MASFFSYELIQQGRFAHIRRTDYGKRKPDLKIIAHFIISHFFALAALSAFV